VVLCKRNQVEEAILRTLGAKDARAAELKLLLSDVRNILEAIDSAAPSFISTRQGRI
jgi:hypothetical protein